MNVVGTFVGVDGFQIHDVADDMELIGDAIAAMLVAIFFGTLIGALAGYFTKLDGPLMRLTDMFLALPLLPLLLVIIMLFRDSLRAAFGPEMGIFILIVFYHGHLFKWIVGSVAITQLLNLKV